MAIKVPVADKWVHSSEDNHGNRQAPAKGFVIHMAEGGTTSYYVSTYLSGNNIGRGVSVHFTVEADGVIVQMLDLARISGSINPGTIRRDDDTNGHFGASHNKAVLGTWWTNPNHAVITVEVAGKAVNGPNAIQLASITKLFSFLKGKYPSIKPLGHRDFQAVKPCPGQKMWYKAYPLIGGHGKDYTGYTANNGEKEDQMIRGDRIERTSNFYIDLPVGVAVFDSPNGARIKRTKESRYDFFGRSGTNWWAIETWYDGGPVIAYIEANKDFPRGEYPEPPVEVPQPDPELVGRIAELELALEQIQATADAALVGMEIEPDDPIDPFTGDLL